MLKPPFEKDNPRFLWVEPSNDLGGYGTYEKPFGRISTALSKVKPDQAIILKPGNYFGDVTIEISGTYEKPIYILADNSNGDVIIKESCWYFYDVCDVVVNGLKFLDSPLGSIYVIGACERNKFENIFFKNCGKSKESSCTMFFGGEGSECNIVENCCFEFLDEYFRDNKSDNKDMKVGLMISEGDLFKGNAIKNHIIRRNKFSNYDYGILIGVNDSTSNQYGHIVEFNTIKNCLKEGIMVKCGDTQIKGNLVQNCLNNSISVITGEGSVIENNRIINSGIGIRVAGKGHTIYNNCLIRCKDEAIRILEKNSETGVQTQNVIIENNTCIDWDTNKNNTGGIVIESGTSSVIKNNIFFGKGKPYIFACEKIKDNNNHLIINNISGGGCTSIKGVVEANINFASYQEDNFTNTSGYGANGWMCSPDFYDPDKDLENYELNYNNNIENEDDVYIQNSQSPANDKDTFIKAMFFDKENS
jgi:hypothetical protein